MRREISTPGRRACATRLASIRDVQLIACQRRSFTMSARTYWSRLFWRNSFRTRPRVRTFRLRLEDLEDRTLLSASLVFDPAAGNLSILGDAADTTMRQSFTSAGFLQVAVDDQSHSSDTTS